LIKKNSWETIGVGLDYDPIEKSAPTVVASERGRNVAQMIRIARRYGVKIHKNSSLAEALSVLDIDDEVPCELFGEVAELLVHYELD
jgi:flagellar biosynthesis protein